jgi:5'-methylthioinosine phosphorylase
MSKIAIIGGTGLTQLTVLTAPRREVVNTPYGQPSCPITHGTLFGKEVAFLARHGYGHTVPPHKINYRANLWALKHVGINRIVAVAAVGGITSSCAPGSLVLPDQIIDYTYGRSHTFFEQDLEKVTHIDFTQPYNADLRAKMQQAAGAAGVTVKDKGTYGATQGPRLETAAEIARLERDGCDIVGMTGMPEAALARELDISYAAVAVVANWAAGKGPGGEITMDEIRKQLVIGMDQVGKLLEKLVPLLD